MIMRNCLLSLFGLVVLTWNVHGTYYKSAVYCKCNGKSDYCLPDALGLHCLDCQDNTAGRHCEKCKDGFYKHRAGESCVSCKCNTIGSVGSVCDSQGLCSCKPGATGAKCNLCSNGATIGSNGCTESQLPKSPNGPLPCFCNGDSTKCSVAPGSLAYNITSTFTDGPDGWRAATAQGLTPSEVHFRWTPTHQDIEVISKDSVPVYLYAPAAYLGNQELSYDQNLSFSLRLDRGVRYPSTDDVILEGSGLKITASLGELHSILPGGQKITYTFRLNEQASSKWRPHLTTAQFQTLLQNLTAIKIRATFGENGRGYLDNVHMGSARHGSGDYYPADETPSSQTCLPGFYKDPMQPLACVRCPCPNGGACSVNPGTLQVTCDLCPPGTTGSHCHICKEGFYGSKCQHSACPSCFNAVKTQLESSVSKLQELETLRIRTDNGKLPANEAQIERILRASEEQVSDLEGIADRLSELEQNLQARLSKINRSKLTEDKGLQAISKTVDNIKLQDRKYHRQASDVMGLIKDLRRQLEEAKLILSTADLPQADAALGDDILTTLVQKAGDLAQRHESKADTVEKTASSALSEAEKSLALMTTVMNKENKVKELITDLKTKYDKTSALVKALDSQASSLSIEAGDESRMAGETLEQLSALELNIPDPLKGRVAALVARLENVKGHVEKNLTGYQALQEDIQGDKAASQELLNQGRAAQKEYAALLARVDAAKADTESSLKGITDNMDGVEDALTKLRGFDDLIGTNKPLADKAIKKLPHINSTIQQAVDKNSQTLFIISNVAGNYEDALATVSQLETEVSGLEGQSDSLVSTVDLLKDATILNNDLQDLKKMAADTQGKVDAEKEKAERQKEDAVEASLGAVGAYKHAKQTRDAIGGTLQSISELFGFIGQPGRVDEQRLSGLEGSVTDARNLVNLQLLPRLQDMEKKESIQRARLFNINQDIDTILGDIMNLEDILEAIPKGCFNSPPIERP